MWDATGSESELFGFHLSLGHCKTIPAMVSHFLHKISPQAIERFLEHDRKMNHEFSKMNIEILHTFTVLMRNSNKYIINN